MRFALPHPAHLRRTFSTVVVAVALAIPAVTALQRDDQAFSAVNTCSFAAPAPTHDGTLPLSACGGIPNRLMKSSGRVNLDAFPVKTTNGYRESRGQAWSIVKDTAGHGGRAGNGGRAWKLLDSRGNRVGSLYSDGRIAEIS